MVNTELTAFLLNKTREQLYALAAELEPWIGGKLPPNLSDQKVRDALEAAYMKRGAELEQKGVDEAHLEKQRKLGADALKKTHPSPETVAIENSPKVYATFVNMENPGQDGEMGADVAFTRGDQYHFHLWDGQEHVLPECLISEHPEQDEKLVTRMTEYWRGLGYKGRAAEIQAKQHLPQVSIMYTCKYPVYEMRQDPTNPNLMQHRLVRSTPRFRFTDVRPAPEDAAFGLVARKAEEASVA